MFVEGGVEEPNNAVVEMVKKKKKVKVKMEMRWNGWFHDSSISSKF